MCVCFAAVVICVNYFAVLLLMMLLHNTADRGKLWVTAQNPHHLLLLPSFQEESSLKPLLDQSVGKYTTVELAINYLTLYCLNKLFIQ